jgi:hypothetical protein
MASITETARLFFDACETGKGWAGCKAYCTPQATFSAQSKSLATITTIEQYADWLKGAITTTLTDATYEVKSFATDNERQNVCAYAIFKATHLAGGPVPPTGQSTASDYVYMMQFAGDKITHLTKIWNSGFALNQLGWTEQ